MTTDFLKKIHSHNNAQTIIEVAVAGALVVAMIGAMVAQGWSISMNSNNVYRGVREALFISNQFSTGAFDVTQTDDFGNILHKGTEDGLARYFNRDGDGSRCCAPTTVIRVMDNLGIQTGKFGSLSGDRVPYMIQRGGAFHTNNMLLPMNDPTEEHHLPLIFLIVNNQRFSFTVASFEYVWLRDWSGRDLPFENNPFWEPYCIYVPHIAFAAVPGEFNPGEFNPDGTPVPVTVFVDSDGNEKWPGRFKHAPYIGCTKLYEHIYNNPFSEKWCDGEVNFDGDGKCRHICADERFDLDIYLSSNPPVGFNSGPDPELFKTIGEDAPVNCTGAEPDVTDVVLRPHFAWQWYPVASVRDQFEDDEDGAFKTKVDVRLRYGRPMQRHDYADVNQDGTDDQVIDMFDGDYDRTFGWVNGVWILNSRGGDLDFESGQEVGLTGNMVMYSQIQDGTFVRIDESADHVKSTRMNIGVVMTEREFILSKSTRFCAATGRVTEVDGAPNPVKACGDCASQANATLTCLEPSTNHLYIRTILGDNRGTKWTFDK